MKTPVNGYVYLKPEKNWLNLIMKFTEKMFLYQLFPLILYS